MASRLTLGAPGIYSAPEEPIRALTGARMDVCAFVGVAPRGPARPPRFSTQWAQQPYNEARSEFPRSLAVPVESFDAYRRLYGGFEGPGLLPYAVAAFFEQGGRRAYVVRIVHAYTQRVDGLEAPDEVANAERVAEGTLGGGTPLCTTSGVPITLRARDEGSWGNRLSAKLSFEAAPLGFEYLGPSELSIERDEPLPTGSLLRCWLAAGTRVLSQVVLQYERWDDARRLLLRVVVLDSPLPAEPEAVERVTGSLDVDDGAGRRERHTQLGLASLHPRWLARALYEDSLLVLPAAPWLDGALQIVDPALPPVEATTFAGGADDYANLTPSDFFDDSWTLGEQCPGAGVHALFGLPDLAHVVAPDLYSPAPLSPRQAVSDPLPVAGPRFAPCSTGASTPTLQTEGVADLAGLRLDPRDAVDLESITQLQLRLVELMESLQLIALLDVPPGVSQRQMLRWRQRFGSAYAAAYHPWLKVARVDDEHAALIAINPAAVAAGIIAARELQHGIPHGPANVLAVGVVDVAERVSPRRHDELHTGSINVYRMLPGGVELTAARTLSRDPAWRQLSVRRLVSLVRRVLEQQMQWAVFEPHDAALRSEVRRMLSSYLRQLYRANAFRGATEQEAFFVRCDEQLNPPAAVEQGRLLAQVGIAPAEPLEFIVLRLTRSGDGTLRVEG